VALRKVKGLLEAGARVTVVAPEALPEFERLGVRLRKRRFRRSDLNGMALAFAATNDRKVNRVVALEAKRRGIPVNVADCPEECDFLSRPSPFGRCRSRSRWRPQSQLAGFGDWNPSRSWDSAV
jgi:siroheme synthase-like protein